MARVDVVVVSFNSRELLRGCVAPLVGEDGLSVIVVDNASSDNSLEAVAGLPVAVVARATNDGFAAGCNIGWRAGTSPFVLFLNPDARISFDGVERLVRALEADELVGAVGPKILEADGALDFSQRRFPRLRSTFGHALFLNQVFRHAGWASELVRDPGAYERPGSPEWISGACILIRRTLLERLDGWDEGFFLYCEDKDLCRRIRDLGLEVRFEPAAVAVHEGGASAPRASLLPVFAASRIRYARKHSPPTVAGLERIGVGLTSLTHAASTRGGRSTRRGYLASLRAVLRA